MCENLQHFAQVVTVVICGNAFTILASPSVITKVVPPPIRAPPHRLPNFQSTAI